MPHDKVQRANHFCMLILTSIAITVSLYFTAEVLVPFVFALIIYEALLPIQKKMEVKWDLSESVTDPIIFMIFMAFLIGIIFFIVVSVGDFINLVDFYKNTFQTWGNNIIASLQGQGISLNTEKLKPMVSDLPILGTLKSFATNVFGFVGQLSLVALLVGFLVFGSRKGIPDGHLLREVNEAISAYLATKFATSFITAILTAIILWFFDSDLILVISFLTFLLNFIPSIGSIFATLLPLPILALKLGFGVELVVCLSLLGATQFTIGNIIEPKFMGKNVNLHPITIMVFLLFWGIVWGVPGMFLSVPITASIKILFSRLEATQPIARLMEGKLA